MKRVGILLTLVLSVLLIAAPACAARPVSTGPTTWGVVGDSITWGVGASDPAHAYPALAGVVGRGFPGQCLVATDCFWIPLDTDLPATLEDFAQHFGVTGVVAEIGVNDLGQITDRQYHLGYRELLAEGAAQGVRVVLSTMTPFGPEHAVTAAQESQRERINAWLRRVGPVVDYSAALSVGNQLRPAYDSGDGLHPSDAGHARMAQVLTLWMVSQRRAAAPVCLRFPCSPESRS